MSTTLYHLIVIQNHSKTEGPGRAEPSTLVSPVQVSLLLLWVLSVKILSNAGICTRSWLWQTRTHF